MDDSEMQYETSVDLEIWRLLPWLANDTLEGEELERVLDHLKRSPRCRGELLFLSELRHAVEMTTADRLEIPERRLEALMARIDDHERYRRRFRGNTPWRLAAQAAVILLAAGVLWSILQRRLPVDPVPQFQTLSSADPVRESPSIGPRVRLIPQHGVTEEALRRLVLELGAEIVAGPTAAGVYTLGWPRASEHPISAERVAETLRSDARVALAEPVRGP